MPPAALVDAVTPKNYGFSDDERTRGVTPTTVIH